jgi:hypothetical protein
MASADEPRESMNGEDSDEKVLSDHNAYRKEVCRSNSKLRHFAGATKYAQATESGRQPHF